MSKVSVRVNVISQPHCLAPYHISLLVGNVAMLCHRPYLFDYSDKIEKQNRSNPPKSIASRRPHINYKSSSVPPLLHPYCDLSFRLES
jgi:hypothetical protein